MSTPPEGMAMPMRASLVDVERSLRSELRTRVALALLLATGYAFAAGGVSVLFGQLCAAATSSILPDAWMRWFWMIPAVALFGGIADRAVGRGVQLLR